MYRNAYQRGLLTIFYSGGSKPLNIWDVYTKDGYVARFLDQEIKSMVLEIGGSNVTTSYIVCPKGKTVLGITMPFLVMVVKNLKKYFSFEITILDETSTRRRFRVSNFQSTTQILPLSTAIPIGLSEGWNQIQFNLAEFTRRAYKKQFVEVQKLKINANIRLRRIYFAERLLPEDELPPEYKLYFPLPSKGKNDKKAATRGISDKENIKPTTSQQAPQPAASVPVEEKVKSETKVIKLSSKTSIHTIKKESSRTSKKSSKDNVVSEQEPEKTTEVQPTVEMPSNVEENAETRNEGDTTAPEEVTEPTAETADTQAEPADNQAEPADAQAEPADTQAEPEVQAAES